MSGYSVDLRERVIKAAESGKTQAWIAATFRLSVSSIKRYISRYKATGSAAPIKQGREQPLIKASDEAAVRAMVARKSDAQLTWYCQEWEQSTGSANDEPGLAAVRPTEKKRRSAPLNVMRKRAKNGERAPKRCPLGEWLWLMKVAPIWA